MLDLHFDTSKYLFKSHDLELIRQDEFIAKQFPIVYVLFDEISMTAYVGESTNAMQRLTTHLSHPEKKKLKRVYVISSSIFNKSAVLDIESYLIQSMPTLGFKLLNGNGGVAGHSYYQKAIYRQLFERIWPNLYFDNIKSKTLLDIENSDIFKYSPYKTLTQDQYNSTLDILRNIAGDKITTTFVNGLAGTGKTILAIYAIKLLSSYHNYDNDDLERLDDPLRDLIASIKSKHPEGLSIGFVVPMTSLRSTLKSVFSNIYGLKGSIVVGPSDVTKKNYDLLFVDEAHRLTRRVSITNYKAFDDTNVKLSLPKDATQLDWVLQSSEKQILFYDSEQSIKPADVRKEIFDEIKQLPQVAELRLISQLRSYGGKDYIEFVDQLLNGKLPSQFNHFSSTNYDLVIFDSMKKMISQLRSKEKEYGLSRLMSGYSWPWISRGSEGTPDVVIDGVELTWNRTSKDWINSTTDATEMGCIHTVQGYDLNYAGVIFGEEITFNKDTGKITVVKDRYFDKKGKAATKTANELHEYIIKIYKTMMYRGIRGTYIYICDENLKEYLSRYIPLQKP